jgi:hypothetical protein
MLDEGNDVFYDVDCQSLRTTDDPSWDTAAPEHFADPAIIFPPNQAHMLGPQTPAIGFLVSITRRHNGEIWARSYGRAIVTQLPPERMSWDRLKDKKGPVPPAEMRAGLMGRLWNRRPGARAAATFVSTRDILDRMPRKWHIDGPALNFELDNMFSAGREIPMPQTWHLHE